MTDRRLLTGAAFALLSSLSFSALTICAVLAYRNGANPLAAVIVRFPGAIVVLATLLAVSRVSARLPRRDMVACWGLSLLLVGQSYTLYTSYLHIPVGLTMTFFYIYPLIVGIVAGLTGQDRISPALALALVIAFSGLLLVFNAPGARPTITGAGLAVLSACFWAAITLFSVKIIRTSDPRAASLHMQVSAAVVLAVVWLVWGGVELPRGTAGWAAFLAMPLCYAVAITAFFAAVSVIGSVRASLLNNIEPITTITLGFVVLGQALTILQVTGAALVICAIFALKWDSGRRAGPDG